MPEKLQCLFMNGYAYLLMKQIDNFLRNGTRVIIVILIPWQKKIKAGSELSRPQ